MYNSIESREGWCSRWNLCIVSCVIHEELHCDSCRSDTTMTKAGHICPFQMLVWCILAGVFMLLKHLCILKFRWKPDKVHSRVGTWRLFVVCNLPWLPEKCCAYTVTDLNLQNAESERNFDSTKKLHTVRIFVAMVDNSFFFFHLLALEAKSKSKAKADLVAIWKSVLSSLDCCWCLVTHVLLGQCPFCHMWNNPYLLFSFTVSRRTPLARCSVGVPTSARCCNCSVCSDLWWSGQGTHTTPRHAMPACLHCNVGHGHGRRLRRAVASPGAAGGKHLDAG